MPISARPRLLVIAQLPEDFRLALAANYELVDHVLEGASRDSLETLPRGHEVIVTRAMFGVPADVLRALPDARLILSLGAGLEQIDIAELRRRGIALSHTPDELTEDVADFAIGLAYAARRRIVEGDRFVRMGRWTSERFPTARNLSRARAGVIGMGRIGRCIADKGALLGMSVRYTARAPRAGVPYEFESDVGDLAAASDILFVACEGTAETKGLVDGKVLAALGPDGILVNIARGSVVDEAALIRALECGTLGGAALDVFANEPNIDSRLLELENIVLSPHAASFTQEAREQMFQRLVGAADAYFE
jgi:hydroxypyruvate reductase